MLLIFSPVSILAFSSSTTLLSNITIDQLDSDGCCFQLNYDYDGVLGNIDGLETRILTPNVLFSSVQFSLNSGWSYDDILAQRRLSWSHIDGNIPFGPQSLSNFCFSGWDTSEPVELLVIWREGSFIRQRDTLHIACTQCGAIENPVVVCEPDSTYTYTFDYVNESEFRVDYLQVREGAGQDFIIEQDISPTQSLMPGQTATSLQLHFRSTAMTIEEFCFEITPRHIRSDGIVLECCTATHCVDIPICDRCCTDYLLFEEQVQQGFSMNIDCDNNRVRIQANALNECDRVRFDITGLGAGIVDGNEAVIFGGLDEDLNYDVCMTVTRQDMNGENCYEEASLQFCDEFLFDCDNCVVVDNIDISFNCPDDIDFVCGCNGMTYLNECAAANWGGLTAWDTDSICSGPMPVIIEHCLTQPNEESMEMMWDVIIPTEFRYFLVQRRISPLGVWETISPVLPNTASSFIDIDPIVPIGHYRVIGVTENGKVIFSAENPGTPCISGLNDLTILAGGRVWPNPVYDQLSIELPIREQQPFEVWNSTGQRLLTMEADHYGQAQITVNHWPAGYYYIIAYVNTNTLWRKPFIIN